MADCSGESTSKSRKKFPTWKDEEVAKLLTIMCDDKIRYELFNAESSSKKHAVYRHIYATLQNSGIDFSLDCLKFKLKKLRARYRLEKERLNKNFKSKYKIQPWKFFNLMQKIYENKPVGPPEGHSSISVDLQLPIVDGVIKADPIEDEILSTNYVESEVDTSMLVETVCQDNRSIKNLDIDDDTIFHRIVIMTKDGQAVECNRIHLQEVSSEMNQSKTSEEKEPEVKEDKKDKNKEEEIIEYVEKNNTVLDSDSDMLYLRSLLPEMKKLSDVKKGIFKIKIQQILHELLFPSEVANYQDHEY